MPWDDYYESVENEFDDFISDMQDEPIDKQDEERDIIICLNCGHLAHFHSNLETGETTDECREQNCYCQSFSPEICN